MSTENIIAVVGIAIGLPGFYIGYIDLVERPRKARQEILDRLPEFRQSSKVLKTPEEVYENLTKCSYTFSQLDAMTTMPKKYFYCALRTLYEKR